ncbi:MAG: LysM peptidoglycan-binding domain-containing protein [Pleurocapsa minor GSE-CHR-MK-17-07R]|jgi:LysM repeat protein|nr:LysM peptidoglycan-binding domain-containing protein [Pleurocapsa minor GSE-CHR-MK 17-07R]
MFVKRLFIAILGLTAWLLLVSATPASAQGAVTCTRTHHIQRGDTLFRIANAYGTTVSQLQAINGLGTSTRIFAGLNLCVATTQMPPISNITYVVQRGDYLRSIARRYGIDWRVLAQVNNITNVNVIYPGQVLYIPEVTIQ